MWRNVKEYLEEYPERLRVARVAGVDRRTVNETLHAINENRELRLIFEDLRSAGTL